MSVDPRPFLSVVVPCFNEREMLQPLLARLLPVLARVSSAGAEILFVDDGSTDGSSEALDRLPASHPEVRVVHLSRNFGHQAALSAGLRFSTGRVVVLMDADLQDPPELIEAFVDAWRGGSQVVYAVRRRRTEGRLKRAAYKTFYRTLRHLAEVPIPLDAGDFCLMDRQVVDAMLAMPEGGRFIRGLRTWVGFRQTELPYDRPPRVAGRPKYDLRRLVRLALDGYIGFSAAPLRLASWLGILAAGAGFWVLVWATYTRLTGIPSPRGWPSTMAVILFLGGTQLVVLGIIGEYLARVYDEVRSRPTYIVSRLVGAGSPPRERSAG
jgi:dolichol-phosphate mannosyltransferase